MYWYYYQNSNHVSQFYIVRNPKVLQYVLIHIIYIVIYYTNFMRVIINIFYLLTHGNLVVERPSLNTYRLDFLKIELSPASKRRKTVEENRVNNIWKDLLTSLGN